MTPDRRRELVDDLKAVYRVQTRRACEVMGLCRATYYYRSYKDRQEALRMKIRDYAAARVRYWYLRIHVLLRREGLIVNRKRVYRLYCLDNLNLRLKPRKKLVSRPRVEVQKESHPNEGWAMDFVSDQLFDGKRFRTLTVVDTYTRECLALYAGQSIQGKDVVEVLNRLTIERDKPEFIRVDNGPEFISKSLDLWAYTEGVRLQFSRPGKPTVNAFIESFNGSFRDECLETNWFLSLENAKNKLEAWRLDYNGYRPHSSLGQLTPKEFAAKYGGEASLLGCKN